MSVAFQNNNQSDTNNRIQSPEYSHGAMWIYNNLPDSGRFTGGNPWSSRLPAVKEEDDDHLHHDDHSTSSSSIGCNSDDGNGNGDGDGDGDGEVQSKDNGVLSGLNDLEEVLPIKRGISTFYAGKSKSYGSLADAVSAPSIQDIVKPEDAYSRKRKNMLAHHVLLDKNRESATENGVSKRLARNSNERSNQSASTTGRSLPPLPRSNKKVSGNEPSPRKCISSPWRSLSLSDLQRATSVGNEGKKVDRD